MRTQAAFSGLLALLLLLFPGCDAERQVYGPGGVTVTPPNPENPAGPVASMDTDPTTATQGVALFGHGVDRDTLHLLLGSLWMNHPMEDTGHVKSFDLIVRIDPGANAEILSTANGSLCPDASVGVMPTGNPGEWRLQMSAAGCGCGDMNPWSYGPYNLGVLVVKIHTPGEWRAEVGAASATPTCACDLGCLSGMVFIGGTVTVAAP